MKCTLCGCDLDDDANRLHVDTSKIPSLVKVVLPQVGAVLSKARIYRCPVGCGTTIHYPEEVPGLLPRP